MYDPLIFMHHVVCQKTACRRIMPFFCMWRAFCLLCLSSFRQAFLEGGSDGGEYYGQTKVRLNYHSGKAGQDGHFGDFYMLGFQLWFPSPQISCFALLIHFKSKLECRSKSPSTSNISRFYTEALDYFPPFIIYSVFQKHLEISEMDQGQHMQNQSPSYHSHLNPSVNIPCFAKCLFLPFQWENNITLALRLNTLSNRAATFLSFWLLG